MSATRSTNAPTRAIDRFEFAGFDMDTQIRIAQRAVHLFDGTRTRGQCWKIAMAEYRLAHPYSATEIEHREVGCTCGWTHVSNSDKGRTHAANSHYRAHRKQYWEDKALVEEVDA